jgi:hypothetical protein
MIRGWNKKQSWSTDSAEQHCILSFINYSAHFSQLHNKNIITFSDILRSIFSLFSLIFLKVTSLHILIQPNLVLLDDLFMFIHLITALSTKIFFFTLAANVFSLIPFVYVYLWDFSLHYKTFKWSREQCCRLLMLE